MPQRAAHEGDMQHAGKLDIGDEAAMAQKQSPILAPWNRLPNEGSCARAHPFPASAVPSPLPLPPPACTGASTSPIIAGRREYQDGGGCNVHSRSQEFSERRSLQGETGT